MFRQPFVPVRLNEGKILVCPHTLPSPVTYARSLTIDDESNNATRHTLVVARQLEKQPEWPNLHHLERFASVEAHKRWQHVAVLLFGNRPFRVNVQVDVFHGNILPGSRVQNLIGLVRSGADRLVPQEGQKSTKAVFWTRQSIGRWDAIRWIDVSNGVQEIGSGSGSAQAVKETTGLAALFRLKPALDGNVQGGQEPRDLLRPGASQRAIDNGNRGAGQSHLKSPQITDRPEPVLKFLHSNLPACVWFECLL